MSKSTVRKKTDFVSQKHTVQSVAKKTPNPEKPCFFRTLQYLIRIRQSHIYETFKELKA